MTSEEAAARMAEINERISRQKVRLALRLLQAKEAQEELDRLYRMQQNQSVLVWNSAWEPQG